MTLLAGQKVLLAVSGGADSMCMADIMLKLGYECSILHCNFNLRGNESDTDESFVRSFFQDKCPVHSISFQTVEYAHSHRISIEMAARDLRYQWFEVQSAEHLGAPVCTAHSKNDNAETLLLNLCRGTGIQGLTGIKNSRSIYRRPLLDCTRDEIEAYCSEYNIPFRTDSSNHETVYRRNKIRNRIIPLFNEINPNFIQTVNDTISKLQVANDIYFREIERLKKSYIVRNQNNNNIDLVALSSETDSVYIFYDMMREYGCTMDQAEKIFNKSSNNETQTFITSSHCIYKRQNSITIQASDTATENINTADIPDISEFASENHYFECTIVPCTTDFSYREDTLYFDFDSLRFPLRFRAWIHGDKMKPLGMNGKSKKISDIFNEHKLSVPQKESKKILTSGTDIIWAIGNKISHDHAIKPKTKKIFCLRFNRDI